MERGISMFEKKVCKGCGKNGFFLKLNSDLLCNECVELKNNEMSMSEVADELVKFVKGEGSAKKLTTYVELQEAKKRRETRNFNIVFGNYEKARSMERQGETDKALSIYLSLLENYPQGTDYYVRPCIILEKKHEYEQAIQICDLAIRNIQQGRFNANIEEFEHRKTRLLRKMRQTNCR